MSVMLSNKLREGKMPDLYATIGGEKKLLNPAYVVSVMCKLCEHSWDDGSHVFPSVLTLERETRVNERYIRYIMKALLEDGFIFLVGHTHGWVNKYVINIDKLNNLEKWAKDLPDEDATVEQEVLEMLGQIPAKEPKNSNLLAHL